VAEDIFVLAIAALLPITGAMTVAQANPYRALIARGILGAVASLVYALFGAADVALTEALVGTMLSITLYAIAVRSSLNLRVGVLETESDGSEAFASLIANLRHSMQRRYLRVEVVPFPDLLAMQTALEAGQIHATCAIAPTAPEATDSAPRYAIQTRVPQLFESLQANLVPDLLVASCPSVDCCASLPARTESDGGGK